MFLMEGLLIGVVGAAIGLGIGDPLPPLGGYGIVLQKD